MKNLTPYSAQLLKQAATFLKMFKKSSNQKNNLFFYKTPNSFFVSIATLLMMQLFLVKQVTAQCAANSTKFPSTTTNAGTGVLTTISTTSWEGDYSQVTGVVNGASYKFNISAVTDIITVRIGSRNGTVLGFGIGTVTVTATSTSDLYVHWNTATCGTGNTNRITTVQGVPTVTSLGATGGCAGSSITINGTNFSGVTASNVTIGGTAVSSITSSSATQIIAIIGSGTTGNITVLNGAGSGISASIFTVNALPAIYSVTGGGIYCSGGSGVAIGLSNSEIGSMYQLFNGGSTVGAAIVGMGSALNFGNQLAAGTFTVLATKIVGGCSATMTGNASISINPLPQGTFSGNAICPSGTGQLTFTASSGTGPYTVVYNDGVANRTASGVVSGTAFNAFSNPSSTTNYTIVSVSDNNGCSRTTGFTGGTATITITPFPTITLGSTAISKCYSTSPQNSSITYSATTNSPTNYSIVWDATALTAGLVNMGSIAISGSPLTVQVAAGVPGGTYTGVLTVTNSIGCGSAGNSFNLTIIPLTTITSAAAAATACSSNSSQNSSLSYSATTNSPTNYTITWNAAALASGLVNVSSTALPASPITVPIAANVGGGTYSGILNVTSVSGCNGTGNNFTLTINPAPQGSLTGNTICTAGAGQLTFIATNGTAPFTIIYNDGVADRTQSGVASGTSFNTFINPLITTNYTLVSITDNNGCARATGFTGATATIAVGNTPINKTPTAASGTICSGNFTHIVINSPQTGVSYQLRNNSGNVIIGSSVAGPGTVYLPTGNLSTTTTFNVLATESASGCNAQMFPTVTVIVNATPTITSSSTAISKCYSSSSQNSSLSYSATTGSPVNYTITWNAAAISAGLVNVGSSLLVSSPITIPVAGGVAAGTYTGTLNVSNLGCISTGNSFTISIDAYPSMTSASSAGLCSGSTVSIPLTSTVASAYIWIAANNAAITGASNSAQSTSTLSNTLINTSSITQIVNYTVAPTSLVGGCTGPSQTVLVTVNQGPATTALPISQTICSGNVITGIVLSNSNSISGTTYTWSRTTPSGISGSIATNGTNVPEGTTITGSLSNSNPSATNVLFTVNSISPAGCIGTTATATVIVNKPVTIATQPIDKTACSGSSVSFTIAATGTSVTYQWRKGNTNLCSCGTVSGSASPTLTINPVSLSDNASDYNCVVTSASCTSTISDYVSLTVNSAASAPLTQPTGLTFPTVNTTSILGTFVASTSATNYLIIRTTTNVTPTNPSNGTTYTAGASALTGYIEYVGTSNVFTSNGLSPNTTYYYWVYAYNTSTCGTSPLYLTSSPLTGNATTATTVACGTVTTLYWGGTSSILTGAVTGTDFNTATNWSTTSPAYTASPVVPTQCNTVSMAFNNTTTITLSANASVYNFTYTISGNGKVVKLSTEGKTLVVNGDAVVDILSGSTSTAIYIGENSSGSGIIDFKANFKIGETNYASGSVPKSYIIGNINSKITFRGDVLFGRSASFILPGSVFYPPAYPLSVPGTVTTPGTIEFDGIGLQQVLWNNNVYYDCFYNIVVGNQNQPYVKHVTGTYTPDNILNNFTINDGCTVDLGTSQWIREQQGGTLTMNGTAKLILGNNQSVRSSSNTGITATGSNFPGGFSNMNISPTSTIEYNGASSITQTVYGIPTAGTLTYGNLILSNGPTTGTANKISTSIVTVAGTTNVNSGTTMTLGAGQVSNGAASVNSGGRLDCSTYIVSGTGSLTLQSGGTLGMGSINGITSSGATGNVQTSARSFSTGGNYVYNGAAAQATGNALPIVVNDLTVANAAGVTMFAASTNYLVAGTLRSTSGSLAINGDTLSINSLQRTSGTLSGSSTSSVGITGTSGVPLFFTSGGRVLKDLFLNASTSASLQTPLDITAGSSAGSVSVASGAALTTSDYLVLKSDANGTARVSEIPVDGSGNALGTISGKVQIERFIPAKRGWRLMTAPIQTGSAPTFNAAWQEGVVNTDYVYANNNNPNPGFGMLITGGSSSVGFDQSPTGNPSIKSFNYTNGTWAGITNTLTSKLTDEQGYMVFVRGNRSTQISLNTAAPLSTTVLRATGNVKTGRQIINIPASGGTFSVVGNPFASTINFKNLSTSANITGSTFVLWDPKLTGTNSVGAFQYFTQLGGPGSDYQVTPGGGSYGAALSVNNLIQSGQAFMVQRNTGSGTVTINENSKVGSSTSTVFRPANNPNIGYINTLMSFVNPDSTTSLLDGVLTALDNSYSDSIDFDDVRKLTNISENFGIQKNNATLQVEKRGAINTDDTIFYKMWQLRVRDYKLSLSLNNISSNVAGAWLQDSHLKTNTPLNLSGITIYGFNVINQPSSYNPNRFRVVFKTFGVLPVTFTNVMANKQNKNIAVEWKVENEVNISNYIVEKSTDSSTFIKVNTTAAINNSNSATYHWIDENAAPDNNYYRIISKGNDGKMQYSQVVKVNMENSKGSINVYPNPVADGIIKLRFEDMEKGNYAVRLLNGIGQVLLENKVNFAGGSALKEIPVAKTLTKGIYNLEVINQGKQKMIVKVIIE